MVRHHPTGNVHAMKAISKRSVLAHDELNHTLTEIKILKQFAIHEPNNPFIVKLNYAFTDKENIYFVMDFYPGTHQSHNNGSGWGSSGADWQAVTWRRRWRLGHLDIPAPGSTQLKSPKVSWICELSGFLSHTTDAQPSTRDNRS